MAEIRNARTHPLDLPKPTIYIACLTSRLTPCLRVVSLFDCIAPVPEPRTWAVENSKVMSLYSKPRVLRNEHPFRGTENTERSHGAAHQATGCYAEDLRRGNANVVPAALMIAEPAPALIATIGTLPLR